jgi:hypothetical protein
MRLAAVIIAVAVLAGAPAKASELTGPGRFCGYAPIIDLLPGEKVTTLESGMHGGTFRWEGAFGSLEVHGTGAAARPKGRIAEPQTGSRPTRFAQRRVDGQYVIAIWNRSDGAAYFRSKTPFTPQQIAAIKRVRLIDDGHAPSGCKLRTVTVWE